jgi:hypothetical protein
MTGRERLQRALALKEWTPYALHRALRAKKVRGASYTNIRLVVDGKREPATSLLRAAAEVLGVREEWLVLGKGKETAAGDALSAGAPAPADLRDVPDGAITREDMNAVLDDFAAADDYVYTALIHTATAWAVAIGGVSNRTRLLELCQALWFVVRWPMNFFKTFTPRDKDMLNEAWLRMQGEDRWVRYGVAMLHAMRLGAPSFVVVEPTLPPQKTKPRRKPKKS